VVDVQNATKQLVMSDELIATIPATRAAGALLGATPASSWVRRARRSRRP
jgi:hypothetical protein